jgi:hypothetical protein
MGEQYKTDELTTDRLAARVPLPEQAAADLAFRLEVYRGTGGVHALSNAHQVQLARRPGVGIGWAPLVLGDQLPQARRDRPCHWRHDGGLDPRHRLSRCHGARPGLSPAGSEGPTSTGITGYQGPTRWRGDGSSRGSPPGERRWASATTAAAERG